MTRVNIYKKMNYSNNHTIVGTYIYVVQVTKPENRQVGVVYYIIYQKNQRKQSEEVIMYR